MPPDPSVRSSEQDWEEQSSNWSAWARRLDGTARPVPFHLWIRALRPMW
jgi:hypothetical protein